MSDMIAKSYNSIKELPSEVRSSFDERDQQKWMDAYNEASESKEPEQAKVDAWMSMVDAPSSLAVETWGSVEVRDADGELVPVKTIEEYADKFIENGGLMHDSHSNVPVGTVWDYEVRKHPETGQDGIVFYFNIYRDGEVFERARDDILSGRKNAVSIGAEAPRGGYKCDDRGCYVERDVTDLYELSICETPANPEAYFINVGKDIAKAKTPIEGELFRIGIKDITVHQDYTTCPLQKCKHDLIEQGFSDVHINDDGKVIAKSKDKEFNLFKAIKSMDYPFRYDLKKEQFEIMIDYDVEHAIEEAVENNWAHKDSIGHVCLTKEIPKEVFTDWYDRGFIVKIGDNYCLKGDDVAKNNQETIPVNGWDDTYYIKNEGGGYYSIRRTINDAPIESDDLGDGHSLHTLEDCLNMIARFEGWAENEITVDGTTYYFNMKENKYFASAKKKVKKNSIGKTRRGTIETYARRILERCEKYPENGFDYHDAEYEEFRQYVTMCVHQIEDALNMAYESGYINESSKKNVKKSIYSVETPYAGIVDFIEGLEIPYTTMDLTYAKTYFEKMCAYSEERRYFDAWAQEYGPMYNSEDILMVFKKLNLSLAQKQYANKTASSKKKVKKDGGAMGVGDAGASNPVYGAKPTSLVTPTGDKKYGRKKKTKKEMTDDGNIHAVGSRQAKDVKKGHGNYFDAIENFIVDSPEGVYYNDILDEFSDSLDEDDILDALEQICSDGQITYNPDTERFAVSQG